MNLVPETEPFTLHVGTGLMAVQNDRQNSHLILNIVILIAIASLFLVIKHVLEQHKVQFLKQA